MVDEVLNGFSAIIHGQGGCRCKGGTEHDSLALRGVVWVGEVSDDPYLKIPKEVSLKQVGEGSEVDALVVGSDSDFSICRQADCLREKRDDSARGVPHSDLEEHAPVLEIVPVHQDTRLLDRGPGELDCIGCVVVEDVGVERERHLRVDQGDADGVGSGCAIVGDLLDVEVVVEVGGLLVEADHEGVVDVVRVHELPLTLDLAIDHVWVDVAAQVDSLVLQLGRNEAH